MIILFPSAEAAGPAAVEQYSKNAVREGPAHYHFHVCGGKQHSPVLDFEFS